MGKNVMGILKMMGVWFAQATRLVSGDLFVDYSV